MTSLDYQRLGNFRYAVITLIGDDGFPFSVSTDFKILPEKKIVLQKPARPSKLDGKRVNILFNHITGLPGGGYGDRRYMLVWGTTHEDHGTLRFEPESLSEWDEKILPFDQYCAKCAPQGAKYLGKLQPSVEA
jgi:1,4-dihydroxy-2-naphthoate polyprenyltransferase